MTKRHHAAALSLVPLALSAALATAPAHARAADPVPPGGIADLTGARALGLSAAVGVLSGNDGLFVNPAAVAARKRYSAETLFTVERRGSETVGKYLGGSVVDALTSAPNAFAFGFVRSMDADQEGNLFLLDLALPIASKVYLGAQARWLDLKGAERVNAVSADAGLYWEVSDLVAVGVAGYNLIPVAHEAAMPRGMGAGVSVGSDTSLKVSADWRGDFDRTGRSTNRYAAGAELFLGNMIPVRGGWAKDETLGTSWWSAGIGLVSSNGMAIDAGYRQSLDDAKARTLSASIKFYFLDM